MDQPREFVCLHLFFIFLDHYKELLVHLYLIGVLLHNCQVKDATLIGAVLANLLKESELLQLAQQLWVQLLLASVLIRNEHFLALAEHEVGDLGYDLVLGLKAQVKVRIRHDDVVLLVDEVILALALPVSESNLLLQLFDNILEHMDELHKHGPLEVLEESLARVELIFHRLRVEVREEDWHVKNGGDYERG